MRLPNPFRWLRTRNTATCDRRAADAARTKGVLVWDERTYGVVAIEDQTPDDGCAWPECIPVCTSVCGPNRPQCEVADPQPTLREEQIHPFYACRITTVYGQSVVHIGCLAARRDAATDRICAACGTAFMAEAHR